MTKEKLLAKGLTEEQVEFVLNGIKEMTARLEEKGEAKGNMKGGGEYVDIEGLKKELEALKKESIVKEKEYKENLDSLMIENAITITIEKYRGRNSKAIRALLEDEKITIDENGKVKGLDSQIEKLMNAEDSKFLFGGKEAQISGATPSMASTGEVSKMDFEKMSYKEKNELFNTNVELYKELKNRRKKWHKHN